MLFIFPMKPLRNLSTILGIYSSFWNILSADELFRFQPNAPMQQFVTPFFNEKGVKTWQCKGETVNYMESSRFNVKNMCITFFNPQQSDAVDMVVQSDEAMVSLPRHRASGQSTLTVTNPDYTIVGKEWVWEGKKGNESFSKVFIGKDAHVIFYEE